MSEWVVETRDLTKVYGEGGGEVRALDGVNLTVAAGDFVAIIGPSGSGKSTLLHMLGALDRPTGGEVIINGVDLSRVRDLDRFRAQEVGFIFQMHNLIPTLTALENVEVPMYESRFGGGKRRARARELLDMVGLGHRLNFLPNQLSGGERQRVAVARALANRPAILLADEPTGNLDSANTAEIMALLADLNRTQGATLIVVTHNPQVARAAHRAVTMRDGKIHSDMPVDGSYEIDLLELKNSPLGQAILEGGELPAQLRGAAQELHDLLDKV